MTLDDSTNISAKEHWQRAFQPRVQLYRALVEKHRGTPVPYDSLALVEAELRALQAQSALLHQCINALRPVSRLSTELLSLIFHYLSLLEPTVPAEPEVLEDREMRRKLAPTKTWIKVTHVCQTFRNCALGDRSLWRATTTAFGPEWMRLLAERGQASPQSVHVGFGASVLSDMKSLLQQAHAVQITSLPSNETVSALTSALSEVRSLRIHIPDAIHEENRRRLWKTYDTGGDTPHLTELHIHGLMEFDVSSLRIPSVLTSLYLDFYFGFEFHLNDLLDDIARLPHLECLTLRRFDLLSFQASRTITLSALRYLCLYSELLASSVHLFDALEFSPAVRVHISAQGPTILGEPSGYKHLKHALSQSVWADLHTLEVLRLPEDKSEMTREAQIIDEGLVFSAWRQDEPGYACVSGPTYDRRTQLRLGTTQDLRPKPDFCLHLTDYIEDCVGQDNALIKVLAFFNTAPELHTLSMRPGAMGDVKIPWADTLLQHPRLTAIRVDNEVHFDGIFEALYFGQEPLLVRELKTVSLPRFSPDTDGFWREHVNWANPTNKKKKSGERGALIANVLLQRAAAGVPLMNIYLDRSMLDRSHWLWEALARGGKDHPEFMKQAQQIFKPAELWDWEEWGKGL
ncbi:hypothetical protein PENSPDRAFT_752618 [Peniophora sp. CONT]|nr:hypothetical protein PENSPDRAFT_752618 [Peniophora sp. CONT]